MVDLITVRVVHVPVTAATMGLLYFYGKIMLTVSSIAARLMFTSSLLVEEFPASVPEVLASVHFEVDGFGWVGLGGVISAICCLSSQQSGSFIFTFSWHEEQIRRFTLLDMNFGNFDNTDGVNLTSLCEHFKPGNGLQHRLILDNSLSILFNLFLRFQINTDNLLSELTYLYYFPPLPCYPNVIATPDPFIT